MPKKTYKAEEIINLLRQIEILVSQGQTAQTAAKILITATARERIPMQVFYHPCAEVGAIIPSMTNTGSS